MEIGTTLKVRLKLLNPGDAQKIERTMEQYRLASNFVSEYIFDNGFPLNQIKLQDKIYQILRSEFGLKSMMAQSCIRQTVARYKTVRTQLRKQKVRGTAVYKDLDFLWYPLYFSRPQADLVRNRDYSHLTDGRLSINTLDGRIFAEPVYKGFETYLDGTWNLGTGKILRKGTHWFLHIGATKVVPDFDVSQVAHVVGIDRGIRQLVTAYDEKGKTLFVNGADVRRKRTHYKELRRKLSAKNTKSSKRRIRKIGQRENRWMSDVNHVISKTLVDTYGTNTLFVLEDLENVRFATEKVLKDQRYEQVSWSFYDLEQKLAYKAHRTGSAVVKVAAHYTSQRCPKCGTIEKTNRHHDLHAYCCKNCGYESNDDRIAAMNIQLLGTYYVSGTENPRFERIDSLD